MARRKYPRLTCTPDERQALVDLQKGDLLASGGGSVFEWVARAAASTHKLVEWWEHSFV
jgi:hypothetical protein